MGKYNVVDLFSGCGGFSYGFEQEDSMSFLVLIIGILRWRLSKNTTIKIQVS